VRILSSNGFSASGADWSWCQTLATLSTSLLKNVTTNTPLCTGGAFEETVHPLAATFLWLTGSFHIAGSVAGWERRVNPSSGVGSRLDIVRKNIKRHCIEK